MLNTGAENFYITETGNFSALAAGQSCQSSNYTFRLPQGLQGSYYVIVQTNSSFQLKETADGNNQHFSIPINISLAPPPDLQVRALTVSPLTAFSQDEVTVTNTVANLLNKTKGVYDVEAIKSGGAAATLLQSFTIRQGPGNTIAGSGSGGPGYGTDLSAAFRTLVSKTRWKPTFWRQVLKRSMCPG